MKNIFPNTNYPYIKIPDLEDQNNILKQLIDNVCAQAMKHRENCILNAMGDGIMPWQMGIQEGFEHKDGKLIYYCKVIKIKD